MELRCLEIDVDAVMPKLMIVVYNTDNVKPMLGVNQNCYYKC